MHMATNHYGHFLVTGRLFPLLVGTPGTRVVTVTCAAYRAGVIDFDDLDWRKRPYSRTQSYGDSKLANLLFMRELQRRFDVAGATALSLAAHPGLTGTERQQTIGIGGTLARVLASPVDVGVRPQLRAAIPIRGRACSDALAEQLWRVTEEITGFRGLRGMSKARIRHNAQMRNRRFGVAGVAGSRGRDRRDPGVAGSRGRSI